MFNLAVVRQLLVAGSVLLAAMSVGLSVAFPSVLLKQLARNDSAIHLDLDTTSWIGSIHGLTGIPSIIMPALMQWKGRKLTFILACTISISGWIIASTATSAASILISESLHGFGSNSVLAVGMLSMSEMLSPTFRNVSLPFYLVLQILGMAIVNFIGWHMHWRTVGLVSSIPMIVAAVFACFWTESPFWLAYKGEFEKCTKAFNRLRGCHDDATRLELDRLLTARRENSSDVKLQNQSVLKYFWEKLTCRYLYLPCIHTFILLNTLYWGGPLVTVIYGSEIFQRATNSADSGPFGSILFDYVLLCCCVLNAFIRQFSQKKLILSTMFGSVLCLLSASLVNYLQHCGSIPKESHVSFYLIVVYLFFCALNIPVVLSMPSELIPVKHRGVGGPLFVIFACLLHSSALKLAPYMYIYLNLWGTWILYAGILTISIFFIWKYIPETKGKTLQQIEEFYSEGKFGNPDEQAGAELLPNKTYVAS